MFHTSQCRLSSDVLVTDTSTSCIQSTKLWVPSGTVFQVNSGETGASVAACVYFKGMMPPSANAFDVKRIGSLRACANVIETMPINSATTRDDFFMAFNLYKIKSINGRTKNLLWMVALKKRTD